MFISFEYDVPQRDEFYKNCNIFTFILNGCSLGTPLPLPVRFATTSCEQHDQFENKVICFSLFASLITWYRNCWSQTSSFCLKLSNGPPITGIAVSCCRFYLTNIGKTTLIFCRFRKSFNLSADCCTTLLSPIRPFIAGPSGRAV